MDWLLAHPDDMGGDVAPSSGGHVLGGSGGDGSVGESASAGAVAEAQPVALSLVCKDCGKQLRSMQAAQTHGERTGHQNFEESTAEIKPLTAEEKQAQLEKMQQLLKSKRVEKKEADIVEQRRKEKARRIAGQVRNIVSRSARWEQGPTWRKRPPPLIHHHSNVLALLFHA